MPFHVRTLPEDFPFELALVVGGFGNGGFQRDALIHPMRTELEYLDALSTNAECKVDLRT